MLNLGEQFRDKVYVGLLEWFRMKQNEDVRMYTWRIYSSRSGYIAAQSWSEDAWKNTGLYTLATKDWEMWELLLGANWQVRVNRITIAWETVTSEN